MYGLDGYQVVNDTVNYPSYAQVSVSNQGLYTWAASTSDVRALQKAASADRIAATWYGDSFDIDINLTDGHAHQVEVYCLDWDLTGRAQRIDVLDAASSALLDSRNVSGFSNGQYLIWNVSGHVKLRVTKTAGNNAVVSGLFFQPNPSGPTPSQTRNYRYDSNPQARGVAVSLLTPYLLMPTSDSSSIPWFGRVATLPGELYFSPDSVLDRDDCHSCNLQAAHEGFTMILGSFPSLRSHLLQRRAVNGRSSDRVSKATRAGPPRES